MTGRSLIELAFSMAGPTSSGDSTRIAAQPIDSAIITKSGSAAAARGSIRRRTFACTSNESPAAETKRMIPPSVVRAQNALSFSAA